MCTDVYTSHDSVFLTTTNVAFFSRTLVWDLLWKKSSQEDMVNALETLYSCNTVAIMQRYAAEEARKRRNLESKGLESWWVTNCMVKLLKAIDFEGSDNNDGGGGGGGGCGAGTAAPDIAAPGEESNDAVYFSPLHTLSAIKAIGHASCRRRCANSRSYHGKSTHSQCCVLVLARRRLGLPQEHGMDLPLICVPRVGRRKE
jgi:hypothetical protein